MGKVQSMLPSGTTTRITIASPLSDTFSIDQSVAHDGVCLTIIEVLNGAHVVEVVAETLSKTTFNALTIGQVLNLETSVTPTTLLDGHIVQGHVDTCIVCTNIEDKNGSWVFTFDLPEPFAALIIPRGSVCLNGVSLTVANLFENTFEVAIIPYTFENTNFKYLQKNQPVNIEFDVVGKYLLRMATIHGDK